MIAVREAETSTTTLSYYTTDALLASQLIRIGVNAQHVENISYGDVQGASGSPVPFLLSAPLPGDPTYLLSGTVTRSDTPSGSFVSNWWQQGSRGNVKLNTNVPVILIGGAHLTLATDPDSALGELIDGSSTGFPLIEQFNTFAGAHMEVGIVLP
jgi:hypothetical protein